MSDPGQPGPSIDPYQVLQVLPTAEQEVLHAAFRALAMKYHPDRDSSARAGRRMIELNQAYALVREHALRIQYDKSRKTARTPFDAAAVPPMNGGRSAPPPVVQRNGRVDPNANATKLDAASLTAIGASAELGRRRRGHGTRTAWQLAIALVPLAIVPVGAALPLVALVGILTGCCWLQVLVATA